MVDCIVYLMIGLAVGGVIGAVMSSVLVPGFTSLFNAAYRTATTKGGEHGKAPPQKTREG